MANIRVDVDYTISDGAELLFYAPCDFADISGLKVYYPGADAGIVSHEFTFQDAHKNDLSNLDNLFAEGACVKVILSLTNSTAYIQNADTNAYLEGRFDAFIDGTQQVGNAKTLDGHGAEEFATVDGVKNNSMWNELTSGFDLNNALGRYRSSNSNIVISLLNKPNSVGSGEVVVEWFPSLSINLYGIQTLKYTKSTKCVWYFRMRQNTTWSEWKTLATTADLANYLQILSNGCTISNNTDNNTPLRLKSIGTDKSVLMQFLRNDETYGYFGFKKDSPQVVLNNGTEWFDILHSGNKPTGTYTGNGDATRRDIHTGAGIGDVLLVRSVNGFAIVYDGAVAFSIHTSPNLQPLNGGEVGFDSNSRTLYMLTDNVCLNAVGVEYKWYVL